MTSPPSLLSEPEKRQILIDWNQTDCDFPRDKCLHQLIEAQAAQSPDKIAFVSGDVQFTYRDFNARANQLAHYLQQRGVGANERVVICLYPSPEFAIAVLGVLKSGAACVPLDPHYPNDRLTHMLQDSQARVIITQPGILPEHVLQNRDTLFLPENQELLASQPQSNPVSSVKPADAAYVIYTSGSTGQPRGVVLTHDGLVNYNFNAARLYSITPDDRVLQFCSVSFDIALEEMFITWLSGATLVFRTEDMPLALPEFVQWIEQQHITVLDLPTAYWHEWVHELPQLKQPVSSDLRLVIVGGEKPSSQAYAKWLQAVGRRVRWINTYGPTEVTICATAFEPQFDNPTAIPENIPIGRPLPNARVYLLDSDLNPVPVGVAGELHVAGLGVARGYFNRPELTAQKFISNPFSSDPASRLYKTGDLARYLPDGNMEFLGRKDDQIKIRGFRVELGEIEAVLAKHSALRDVAVIAAERVPGDKQLVAYLVPANGSKPAVPELRQYLIEKLPDYMLPATFVFLETMPLTPNGKINRRGLPAPQFEQPVQNFTAPTTPLEAQLLKLWEDVLGKKPIGIHDNFFELGGHSLLAARLMHRTGRALGKTLPLAMLFDAPTVAELAALLEKDEWAHRWSSLVPIQPLGSRPPFFCIHGVGGNVVGFQQLGSRMGPHHPFYGLQSQGLDGKNPCHSTVEAMASHYIAQIRTVQPEGPYFLGGFSFGGIVAYEMAQQLHSQGQHTALLVLFDTYPGDLQPVALSLLKLLLKPSRQHWFHDVPKKLKKRFRRTVRAIGVPKLLIDVRNANRAAADRYQLRPYAGKATLVRAQEKSLRAADPHAAWKNLVAAIDVHDIDCDHYEMLIEPRVNDLADYLKNRIDQELDSQRAASSHSSETHALACD